MKKWNEITKGSKITLAKDKKFNGFDGQQVLKAGKYYINGFWVNACGLKTKRDIRVNEYVIPSIQLRKFEGIE